MNYVIAALAVYKVVQLIDALTPKEAMPWVKVVVGIVLGYVVSFVTNLSDKWVAGLVVATLAGACHAILRLITLVGDMATRRIVR